MGRVNNGLILGIAGLGVALAIRERARQRRAITFQGKVALITGGSRGLGSEIARQLADKGAKLALCARSLDELERAQEELKARGQKSLRFPSISPIVAMSRRCTLHSGSARTYRYPDQ